MRSRVSKRTLLYVHVISVCTPDPTITFGVLEGDRFYSGSAFVNCDDGYEGDGAAICLPSGTWDLANLPACTAKGLSKSYGREIESVVRTSLLLLVFNIDTYQTA